jgi:Alpha/beta hydrolase domain
MELSTESLLGGQPELVRDELGSAVGGIRLPDFAVPTATHVGESIGAAPDLVGHSTPFTPEKRRRRLRSPDPRSTRTAAVD